MNTLTMAAWINQNPVWPYTKILAKTVYDDWRDPYGYYQFLSSKEGSELEDACFAVSNYTTFAQVSGQKLQSNVWNHYVGSWDGSTIRMYYNGTEVFNQAIPDLIMAYHPTIKTDVRVGARPGASPSDYFVRST